ncbi:MAG: hypothetical protein IKN91_05530 [Paludibacteraceae bacterium]|nr:hypothetical protein [Paludibacteraceae bacterium]
MTKDQLIEIGHTSGIFGTKGELQCQISNPVFDDMDIEFMFLEIDGTYIPFFIDEYRWKSDTSIVVKFIDVDSQQSAQQIVGHKILIEKTAETDRPAFNTDIVGYVVFDQQSGKIGTITDIDFITDENAVLQLDNELIIPFHADLVSEINHAEKSITMQLPEGLIE